MTETAASTDMLVGAIGEWYNAIVRHDIAEAKQKKTYTEELRRHVIPDKKVQTYYQLVDFRHKILTEEILHRPLGQDKAIVDESIADTDNVLKYLYHHMEGRLQFYQEHYLLALRNYQQAERHLDHVSDLERAEFYYLLGEGFYRVNQYMHANAYFEQAKELFSVSSQHQDRVHTCNYLQAAIYSELKHYEKAEELFNFCLNNRELDEYTLSLVLRAYGLHKERHGELVAAKELLFESLYTGNQYETLIGTKTKTNLANLLLRTGDSKGFELLEEAEQETNKYEMVEFSSLNLITRGLYDKEMQLSKVEQGINQLIEYELYFEATEAAEQIAEILEDNGNFQYALHYLKIANELRIKQNSIGVE
ncbi:hypothetical protein [Geomicrobium sp. JCM 19039]|uniref:response regulator aspartate phosphatase n=1 Tax=Geomicrobium sp. JCM 19039 TaxID=1460636 RepID=UPI00045F31D0|nr:hypothetical protein [Geomicrobium sp. JCM 19039]GAK13944.1 response regulator aspartate phosphatase [Geomicrobium sp. JCM 19039]